MSGQPWLFKWRQFEAEIIVCAVRWYLRYRRYPTDTQNDDLRFEVSPFEQRRAASVSCPPKPTRPAEWPLHHARKLTAAPVRDQTCGVDYEFGSVS